MSHPGDILLPEGVRLLHIGPHKTGTTAIQVSLGEARDRLAEYGVTYAGAAAGPGAGERWTPMRPSKAGWALGIAGRPAGTDPPDLEHWHRLVREVEDAGPHRVCVSNEDFARATPEQIRRVVDGLGGERAHVVAVARRLDRYLPSQWQERVKAGDQRSYDTWLRVVLDRDTTEADWDSLNVWHAHDTARLIERWVDVVGPDRFTLIVADEADPNRMHRIFERMLGLPEGSLVPQPDRSNRSLSWAETELVRAVNVRLAGLELGARERRHLVKGGVIADLLASAAHVTGPRTPPMPAWAVERVIAISAERVAALRTTPVRVLGDPELLRVPDGDPTGGDGEPPLIGVEAAASAAVAMTQQAMRVQRRRDRQRATTAPASSRPDGARGWVARLRRQR